MDFRFHAIGEAIADIREGKIIIVVDDEDRENEGGLSMAAKKVIPEASQLYGYARARPSLPAHCWNAAGRAWICR